MHRVLCLLLAVPVIGSLPANAQGTIVYRTASEMISSFTLVDMNQDGVVEFDFRNGGVGLGEFPLRTHSLTPNSPLPLFPEFAGEVMMNTSLPMEIQWSSGQIILPDPSPLANWTGDRLDMTYMLAAVRIRAGDDWHNGWLRFEKVGEDGLGDVWGLRDGAYNSIPNASINMLQVPEPSTWALIGCGLTLLAFRHRERGL